MVPNIWSEGIQITNGEESTFIWSGGAAFSYKVWFAESTVIDEAGNLGIGTATPTAKLDVMGDATVQGNLTVTGVSGPPSNALVVHKNGEVRAAGKIQSKGGFRTPPMGDLNMGEFTAGANPADPANGLNASLRYPGE
jgi:hypothetical protein